MNNKFDELARGLAQSTTRRRALKKFGLAGMALACFGLAETAAARGGCLKRGHVCGTYGSGIGKCDKCCSGSWSVDIRNGDLICD